jgi:hypothetical protein
MSVPAEMTPPPPMTKFIPGTARLRPVVPGSNLTGSPGFEASSPGFEACSPGFESGASPAHGKRIQP